MRAVLQKLLHPGMSQLVRERGYAQVGGHVVAAADATGLRTANALREAYGWPSDPSGHVDVVRFEVPVCATLTAPPQVERPWPSYPLGFLRPVDEAIVPVWSMSTTRYSPGAELWRISDDGQQELLAAYGGAARGWTALPDQPPVEEWHPSSRFFGTRAVHGGTEFAADVHGDQVELTSYVEQTSAEWSPVRVGAWTRTVPLAACDVYELGFTATLGGVPLRVLEQYDGAVRAQLLTDDPETASRLSAVMVDYGVFEVSGIPGTELGDTQLVADQLVA
ncbi:hypothetical protein [uncultured Microbacterium sp.]|uniref:hypothetical protein n=1 Tax=uncultured Microbacterium sp. TaxID=191216 RepID=UPI0028D3DF2C|nr:hypothetical protein [uncultured Microbacterium sp.]